MDQLTVLVNELQGTEKEILSSIDTLLRRQTFLHFVRLLRPYQVDGFNKLRIGSAHDGGYIMIDDFSLIDGALSFGVGQDVNWEIGIAKQEIPVHLYDHTVDALPAQNEQLVFRKVKLIPEKGAGRITLTEATKKFSSRGDGSKILKMDIEGDEWNVFLSIDPETLPLPPDNLRVSLVGQFPIRFRTGECNEYHQKIKAAVRGRAPAWKQFCGHD